MQTAFYAHVDGKFKCIPFIDVLYIVANGNYSEVVTVNKKKICIYATLSCLEEKLPEKFFCRIHRSYIISLLKVEEFSHKSVVIDKEELPMSKSCFEKLSKQLLVICKDSRTANLDESLMRRVV